MSVAAPPMPCCAMEIEKPRASKSPQQKKAESYAGDRRNACGENDKASRKAIPARKAHENRKSRRKAAQALGCAERLAENEREPAASSLRHDVGRVGGWRKSPDAPLGEVLIRRRRRRG